MSLFPRFVANEFAPMFRLMDDYASHVLNSSKDESGFAPLTQSLSKFQPKFDVKETGDSYELRGELPGVAQQDISVEFTDAQTLTIRGQTESVREEGSRPTASIEAKAAPQAIADAASTKSHQTTVEDENAPAESDTASTVGTPTPATEVATPQPQAEEESHPHSRYWLREMSRGSFSRVFSFPSRVDQENVRASLRDGILSVVVPKAAAPVSRRIAIQ
ncbi:hypothetical protein LTR62_001235 [Meristemomyces frigidus]|uniref:SHSP domain-containing protein n=1 Tax=Meristemomyces frigidus TaxID=1508187 RepID=A0AAN7TNH2_9PEZI|nr:hypothetical protein LTR62_001235 [Meristemomyces frigidus]